ncbi:uncharacterized protein BBOV_IV003525 [Babesia bovis T2Bo]|uniref:uncharacterized protein n=1 Tax=Babesia bovis T2Bo TaxID=484906 RepID=UPI001D931DEE|nr:uncharacterized protein BBOV_IV003525 [Babesia bovis T2Bo]KAG6439924.1 hypothetical protein BBOV_IV003525 [Babesia bovis T2Bo]
MQTMNGANDDKTIIVSKCDIEEDKQSSEKQTDESSRNEYFWKNASNRDLLRSCQSKQNKEEYSPLQDTESNINHIKPNIYISRTTQYKTIPYETYCRQKRAA